MLPVPQVFHGSALAAQAIASFAHFLPQLRVRPLFADKVALRVGTDRFGRDVVHKGWIEVKVRHGAAAKTDGGIAAPIPTGASERSQCSQHVGPHFANGLR